MAVVWGVDDVAVLERKSLRARSITASKITTTEASLNVDICYYFVVSCAKKRDVGYNTRD
jgi:hypothetical protein